MAGIVLGATQDLPVPYVYMCVCVLSARTVCFIVHRIYYPWCSRQHLRAGLSPIEEMHVGMLSEYYQVLVGVKTYCSERVLQVKDGLSLSLIDIGDPSASLESW